MPSTVRVVSELVQAGKMDEAFEKLSTWLRAKPGAVGQPDFIAFCRGWAGVTLMRWHIQKRKEAKTDGG